MAVFDIRIKGQLDTRWTDWFDGLIITNFENDTAQLTGDLVDQAALHGTLNKVRDLNLTLISVASLGSPTGKQETVPTSIEQEGESNAGATNHLKTRATEH